MRNPLVHDRRLHGGIGFGRGGGNRRQRTGQRNLQDLVHVLDEIDIERIEHVLGDIGEILLVVFRQDDVLQAGTVCRENLFLHATDRQDLAAERDLAGHGDVLANFDAAERRHERGRERNAC